MNMGPLVDIVILNLNQERDTLECILSLKKMAYKAYRIILVDNGSVDDSGFRIREKNPTIEFLRKEQNLGFAGGCNAGITHSLKSGTAGYVLLLNNDTVIDEHMLDRLLEVGSADKQIGIIGAVNFYYDRPEKIHMAWHRFIWALGGIHGRSHYTVDAKFKEVQSVPGSCMLIKKEVIEKIGLLDERFFAYYEDADFCLRAQRGGFKVAAATEAKIWHKINKILGAGTPREYYIYTRNQPLFMLKNCPKIFLLNFFILYFLKVPARIILFFIIFKWDISAAVLKGCADFFTGNFGKGRLFEI